MKNSEKLQSIERELQHTINHAQEMCNEYVKTAMDSLDEVLDSFDEENKLAFLMAIYIDIFVENKNPMETLVAALQSVEEEEEENERLAQSIESILSESIYPQRAKKQDCAKTYDDLFHTIAKLPISVYLDV